MPKKHQNFFQALVVRQVKGNLFQDPRTQREALQGKERSQFKYQWSE